jgi:dihydropteroate synthase
VTTLVMGVVNVTPDSFSDGGRWFEPGAAIEHGEQLLAEGADILDIGGESTRPGAQRPDEAEELRRVIPVVRELARLGARVSIDTMRASVAARAMESGAAIVNDVSGGLADPRMASTVAGTGVPFIAMHWRGHSERMHELATYTDVVGEVCAELRGRAEALCAAGLSPEQLILDPGFGFAKLADHNWTLLAHLEDVAALGHPILVGTSRKRFLGGLGLPDGATPRPPDERDAATAATTVLAARAGAWAVRVHDVASSVAAVQVVAATEAAR